MRALGEKGKMKLGMVIERNENRPNKMDDMMANDHTFSKRARLLEEKHVWVEMIM